MGNLMAKEEAGDGESYRRMKAKRGMVVVFRHPSCLIVPVQPRAKGRDRTAIPVEGRIADELIINGSVNVLQNLKIVVGFQKLLQTVSEFPVASENARPASGKEFLMELGNAIDGSSQAERVLWPMSEVGLDADS
jgi:hypothetical protein